MRCTALLLILPLLGGWAPAESPPATQQAVQLDRVAAAETIRAASDRAVETLHDQISRQTLAPGLTVAQFLRSVDGEDEFRQVLRRADQIGAPRWTDPNTVQVQLSISTVRITQALKTLVAANPRLTNITVGHVDRAARDWPRAFSATGSSASGKALVDFRPMASDRWRGISPEARQKALAEANANAGRQIIQRIEPIVLADRTTLRDALEVPGVRDSLQRWLATRPVTRVEFCDDLEVEVQLAVHEQDLASVVRTALQRQRAFPTPADPKVWEKVERELAAKVGPAVGRAAVAVDQVPLRAAVQLPPVAPPWADDHVEVNGEASGPLPEKLRTSVAAEKDARAKLRQRMESLPLTAEMTVGEGAKRDARIAQALDRVSRQARLYRIRYHDDGAVTVSLTADLRDLWDEIRR